MRVGYIRAGCPWSITTQAAILVDYDCELYCVEGPSYKDTTEWSQLVSRLRMGDEVVVMSLFVFGSTSQRVKEVLSEISQIGATLINWGEIFFNLPSYEEPTYLTQVGLRQDTLVSPIIGSVLADAIRACFVMEGLSVSEISDHFALTCDQVKEILIYDFL